MLMKEAESEPQPKFTLRVTVTNVRPWVVDPPGLV
jgi:hypothetical protein